VRGRLAALGVVLALAVGLLVTFGPDPEAARGDVFVPVGYAREVDRLIADGKLVYRCTDEAIETVGLSPAEEYFLRHSKLDDDLAAWAGGDRRPFVVERSDLAGGRCEGGLLRVNASYHNQRLPTYRASSWTGRLYLRQSAASTRLASGDRVLDLVRPPLDRLPLEGRDYQDVWFGAGRGEDVRAPRLAFKMYEAGRSFAQLTPLGDATRLEVTYQRPELRLDGCPLEQGDLVRLEHGDALRVWARTRDPRVVLDERFQVESGGEAGLLSFVTRVDGEVRRRTYGGRLGMAEDVARALDVTAIRGEGRDDFDVHLTVDAFLDHTLSRVLDDFARRRYRDRPLRAAVTVLEADTGRALALPSYPAPGDVEDLRLRRPGDAALLARNHNFDHHPVGSVAKPLLAAAALAARPELAGLEVPCRPAGAASGELLGYPLGEVTMPGDCGGVGEDGRVDLVEFLRVSSNRYVLYLGTLALADWSGGAPRPDPEGAALAPGDAYALGGRTFDRRPRLPVVKDAAGPATELADVADRPLFQRFGALFGAGWHYRADSPGERIDLAPWRPALAAAVGEETALAAAVDEETALAFSPVAPEEVNLRANLIQQLRQDLYTTLLGVGNHRWSNLQLAAAYARLATGRTDLEPRLVERVAVPAEGAAGEAAGEAGGEVVLWSLAEATAGPPPEGSGTEAAGLSEADRRLVLEGMRQVVDHPAGTAHALDGVIGSIAGAAPPGVTYRLLAKTGTPSDDLAAIRRGVTAPARGAIAGGGRFVESAVLALVVERLAPGGTSRLVVTLWIEGQGGSGETVALAAQLLRPLVEARWPEDWMEPER